MLYARGLLPEGALFTAIGIGRSAFQSVALSYLAGGHIRVGLEDGVYIDHGVLAPSNAALVRRTVEICEKYHRPVADCATARSLLGLRAAA